MIVGRDHSLWEVVKYLLGRIQARLRDLRLDEAARGVDLSRMECVGCERILVV